MRLVQLVKKYKDKGKTISWDTVARKMKPMAKTKLQGRLKTLKRHYGHDLSLFPARFFAQSIKIVRPVPRKTRVLKSHILATFNAIMALYDTEQQQKRAGKIIDDMFASKTFTNQLSISPTASAGEVTSAGVSRIITSLMAGAKDVFIEFGAGVGKVLAQVALQTSVSHCLGIEMSLDAMEVGKRLIGMNLFCYPILRKISFIGIEAKEECDTNEGIRKATLLYSFNTLFTLKTNEALIRLVCRLPVLRRLVLAEKPCGSHSTECKQEFCLLWKLMERVEVEASCQSSRVAFYVYDKITWRI